MMVSYGLTHPTVIGPGVEPFLHLGVITLLPWSHRWAETRLEQDGLSDDGGVCMASQPTLPVCSADFHGPWEDLCSSYRLR